MRSHEDETESYLKEFRPKAIGELDTVSRQATSVGARKILWRRMVAGAALAACVGGIFWFARRESWHSKEAANGQVIEASVASQRQYPTTLALTKLALSDKEKFETLL